MFNFKLYNLLGIQMISSILYGLAHVSIVVLDIATFIIIVSAGISIFNADPYNPYVRIVRSITEPIYRPIRRLTNKIQGPIDFAPLVACLLLVFLKSALPRYLLYLSTMTASV